MNSNARGRALQKLPYIMFSLGPVWFDNIRCLNLNLLCGIFVLRLEIFSVTCHKKDDFVEEFWFIFQT